MIYKASKGQNRGRSYIISSAPGNAVLSVHKTHYDKHDLYSSTGEIGQLHPSPEIFSLKPLHLRSCPMKRRYCTPLSCAGRSYPARTAGRTSTGAFTCIIQSARWSPCSTVGGKRRSTPCGNYSMRGLWRYRNRAVENQTVSTQNPMKRFQTLTSRNPVPVRRRAEKRT